MSESETYTTTPTTQKDAYKEVLEAGDDVSIRRRVAAALVDNSLTTHEITQRFEEHGKNAIRPRINELLRMGCVIREGTRTNPSGHEAYVHHLTDRGYDYVIGDIDPDPNPPLSEHKHKIVTIARHVVFGDVDTDVLRLAVEKHDRQKKIADPEWEPELSGWK